VRDLSELNINEGGRRVARPAPTAAIITAFQTLFGITLPEGYLKLLRHSNGGHPELDSIKPGMWAVDRFYHLDDDRTSTESLWFVMEHWRPILGPEVLPFATDGCGNQFVLDLNTSPPRVRVCVHDENFSMVDLASSFEAFIDALGIDPEAI